MQWSQWSALEYSRVSEKEWNTVESMECCGVQYNGVPSSTVEYSEVQWNRVESMEYSIVSGIRWPIGDMLQISISCCK